MPSHVSFCFSLLLRTSYLTMTPSTSRLVPVSTASRPVLGPTQYPIQWVPSELSLEVMRPGREADGSLPSSAEVKNSGAIPHCPSTSVYIANLYSTKFSIFTITRVRYNRPKVADVPSGPSLDSTPHHEIFLNYTSTPRMSS
jgi:hypothetical protein